jgi:uncharacterized membrane protein YtjA (UPF0391 family)
MEKSDLLGNETMPILNQGKETNPMLGYALAFFIVAIIAGIFGFGVIAGAATGIAQILFFLFIVLFVVSLVAGLIRRPRA